MVIEHKIIGSKSTTLHNFSLSTNGMEMTLSAGEYYLKNELKISSKESATFTIPTSPENMHYELWLTVDGLEVIYRKDNEAFSRPGDFIDKISWFTVPANFVSLDNVEVNFIKVVDENAS